MGEDSAVYSKQSPWREAEEQSAHFERDHACAQERMSMGRLSAGIWAGQDGLQSLQPLECAGNLVEYPCASLPPWHSGFSRARFSALGITCDCVGTRMTTGNHEGEVGSELAASAGNRRATNHCRPGLGGFLRGRPIYVGGARSM